MAGKFHTLYFEATRECNFSCKYCSSGSNLNHRHEKELTYNEIIERIFLPAKNLGTKFLDLSGGEFLLRKDAFQLLEKANKMGFRISIASNGSTLNNKTIKRLKSLLGDNLMISLGVNSFDSKNKETRDTDYDLVVKP